MENLTYGYLLPIGSIIRVTEIEQKLMIIGVLQKAQSHPEYTFDYVAVPYPEGMHDPRLNYGINHADIEEVVFRGFENDERKAFLALLEAAYQKVKGNQ